MLTRGDLHAGVRQDARRLEAGRAPGACAAHGVAGSGQLRACTPPCQTRISPCRPSLACELAHVNEAKA